jgi:hypothetical protein
MMTALPAKYVVMRDLVRLARIDSADGVIFIGEAWTSHYYKDTPNSGVAANAKKPRRRAHDGGGKFSRSVFYIHRRN